MKILAFIPARKGSERVPNKNIRLLDEKPLIAHTILAAKKSSFINRVVVSTDSEEIAAISQEYGAEVPFMRPSDIAQGNSTEMQFFEHALQWFLENENYRPDLIVLLYPTSPFRQSKTIDQAITLIQKNPQADSLRSVRKCSEHPYKMWTVEQERLCPFVKSEIPNLHTLSTQLFPTVYIQNASIYITKPSTILEKKSPTGDIIVPFIMDEIESVDINSPLDFEFAEMLLNKGQAVCH